MAGLQIDPIPFGHNEDRKLYSNQHIVIALLLVREVSSIQSCEPNLRVIVLLFDSSILWYPRVVRS